MTTVWLPDSPPLVAARTYLLDELAQRGNPLPIEWAPPDGDPAESYALLSRWDTRANVFLGDYLLKVRVFDADIVRLEQNADLIHRLMLAANHRKIVTPLGPVWITAATHHFGPAEHNDDDIPLPGMMCGVFWTIGLKPRPA